MTHLILVRHSITQRDPSRSAHEWTLTDEGRARCLLLAEELRPYRIAHIVSSGESKAVATADILGDQLGISDIASDPDFGETRRETAPYLDDDAFRAAIQTAMQRPDEVLFGEEAFTAARLRFIRALDRAVTAHPDRTIAVVSHGTILSLVLGHHAGVDAFSTWRQLGMPAYAVLTPNFDLLDLRLSL